MNRYRYPLIAVMFVLMNALLTSPWAKDKDNDAQASEAFRVLAREQSLAEGYVVLMKTLGPQDFARYAEGIRRYARARAEFDGLIAQIKYALIHREPFERSAQFQAVLQRAVERRLAFTQHVDAMVAELTSSGTRAGVKDYIKAPQELVSAIRGAASAIWEKYWSVREGRRQETLAQLEALKWKPFHAFGD
jgi:hypothetical protein